MDNSQQYNRLLNLFYSKYLKGHNNLKGLILNSSMNDWGNIVIEISNPNDLSFGPDTVVGYVEELVHNFTKFREKYLKYRLSEDDTKKDIQNKFDNFIKEYHAWRNMAAGAGLNLIEILSRKNPVITKDMYIENTKAIKDYYYYDQAYFLNKDFQKNKTIFSEILNRDCDVIKYENLNLIYQKYPNIFTEKIVYENFDKLKNGKSQLNRIPYQAYYSKYTKKFVQEHFEIDFYNFHYSFDFNLI